VEKAKKAKEKVMTILVSRTDAIGDVMLTLPLCGLLKQYFPSSQILFIGRTYTAPIIACCAHVDGFINVDELSLLGDVEAGKKLATFQADVILHVFPNRSVAKWAKLAKINLRIGTTNRLFHWGTVNRFVPLSRKKSTLHEAQLNCKLLAPLGGLLHNKGLANVPSRETLATLSGFHQLPACPENLMQLVNEGNGKTVVLHPLSNQSAREWGLAHYGVLIELLFAQGFRLFITGTVTEGERMGKWLDGFVEKGMVTNLTGKLSLTELIGFLRFTAFFVSASTGPLHIAAATGVHAIGIFPPMRPIHPGRWQPIGENVKVFCLAKACTDCRKSTSCPCMTAIQPAEVAAWICKQ